MRSLRNGGGDYTKQLPLFSLPSGFLLALFSFFPPPLFFFGVNLSLAFLCEIVSRQLAKGSVLALPPPDRKPPPLFVLFFRSGALDIIHSARTFLDLGNHNFCGQKAVFPPFLRFARLSYFADQLFRFPTRSPFSDRGQTRWFLSCHLFPTPPSRHLNPFFTTLTVAKKKRFSVLNKLSSPGTTTPFCRRTRTFWAFSFPERLVEITNDNRLTVLPDSRSSFFIFIF